ncbi:MAG: hypothetical protein KME55_26630 [Nostoc indistinguendum CM1-VF10]|jgi:hypothetical protein|nr:hypothetical protein [Nostoc indistinguendum CM1-VF10]
MKLTQGITYTILDFRFWIEKALPRLAVSSQSLIAETEKLSLKEFISWSRNRDPISVGWEWDARTELYHLVK